MKNIKNNFLVKFVVALFLIGLTIGLIFYLVYKPDMNVYLESFKDLIMSSNQNTFITNIVAISAIFVLSISIIGLPVIAFYIFYEGISIGFTFSLFLSVYHLKGAIFYFLFFLISKAIYLGIILYFTIIGFRYALKFIDAFLSKNRESLYKTIVYHFYRFIILLVIIIANSTLVYFFANKIVNLFINLI